MWPAIRPMKPAEALLCARASETIYQGKGVPEKALQADGFSEFAWIDLTTVFEDVCAFVASSPQYNLLAFRGTQDPQDWMEDVYCTPVRFDWIFQAAPAVGEIHAGFGHTLADKLANITQTLAGRDQGKALLITGHSLGGALAALAAAYLNLVGASVRPVTGIYTFGQPRIGLHDFCNTYDRILARKLVRFVNKQDLVPRVPFRGWDYSDEGLMIHFDSNGIPSVEADEWQNFLARTLQSLGDFVEIMSHVRVDAGDHSMTGYRELVENSQQPLAPLLR